MLKRYRSQGRHYHTLSHIEAMLNWHAEFASELKEPELVALAIWYHDAIYVSLRKDNEARSAALARKQLSQLGLAPDKLGKIEKLILQTANHHGPILSQDPDLCWFLDFDLSILGAEPAIYKAYAEAIRKEYRLVPEPLYRAGRGKILRKMLEAEFLYYTPAFRRSHERLARRNLLEELRRLQALDALGLD
ncbi:MAG: hypothetical protein CVV27_04335 [Candidatus Melainabacteria bacterium HGW-Melainabacteria-1]|nr:MAG: hypothetical protein CVV27_04335 [Candidatus Melainabacteria bacterium HGW-Melainabacteria-1]